MNHSYDSFLKKNCEFVIEHFTLFSSMVALYHCRIYAAAVTDKNMSDNEKLLNFNSFPQKFIVWTALNRFISNAFLKRIDAKNFFLGFKEFRILHSSPMFYFWSLYQKLSTENNLHVRR